MSPSHMGDESFKYWDDEKLFEIVLEGVSRGYEDIKWKKKREIASEGDIEGESGQNPSLSLIDKHISKLSIDKKVILGGVSFNCFFI